MGRFPDRDLVVVGRTVTHHEGSYFVNETHWELLSGLAREFASASYVCMATEASDGAPRNGAPIDQDVLEVVPNWAWKDARLPGKLWSLRKDRRFLKGVRPGTVTYCYYPGFYSFLLSPTILRNGAVNVTHFGSSAVETAQSAFRGSPMQALKRRLYARFQEYVLANADVVLCTGPGMADEYDEAILSRPILKFTTPSAKRLAEPCDDEPIELLYVGAFRPLKGHEHLINAFRELRAESEHEYRLTLVGSGSTKPRIEGLVEEFGLKDEVRLTGYVSERDTLESLYLESDVFVLPSLKEAVPWVLYEATLTGLPIVATRVGGIPSFFEGGEDAILVPPGENTPLAKAIERVVRDDRLRGQLIENAQKVVHDHVEGDPVEQRLELITRAIESGPQ